MVLTMTCQDRTKPGMYLQFHLKSNETLYVENQEHSVMSMKIITMCLIIMGCLAGFCNSMSRRDSHT